MLSLRPSGAMNLRADFAVANFLAISVCFGRVLPGETLCFSSAPSSRSSRPQPSNLRQRSWISRPRSSTGLRRHGSRI
ncbi:unnamed protein product [Linum trigynum]|uniref:Uncharacterized protein n=1 Tax=Linum trigynum TaxID=586398 RepID=A0AAV2E1V2_9ROSI